MSEKLDKKNHQAWKFRIFNFLMGKDYWDFITWDEQKLALPYTPTATQVQALKTWHERSIKIMYWISIDIIDAMIMHIQDAEMPKDVGHIVQIV